MDRNVKRSRCMIIVLVILYAVSVVCLFWFHPFVASAAETDTPKKNVPGGNGNTVHIRDVYGNKLSPDTKYVRDRTLMANDDVEILGYLKSYCNDDGSFFRQDLCLVTLKDGNIKYGGSPAGLLSDYVGVYMTYKNDQLTSSSSFTDKSILEEFAYYYFGPNENMYSECIVTGMKIFKDDDALAAYVENGSLDGMIKEDLDTSWYLKNLGYKVTADDSPSGSGGEDATYITFTWLTDNLQDGDLLEIKTYNHYKKIGGDKISGFHDYITFHDNVSCLGNISIDNSGNERASYAFGQYEATKSWFATLENKPLIFKSYDTDIYYLRPYRDGKVGKWCKVTMGRNPATNGSPYIEKIEIGDIDDDGEFVRDDDLTEENGGDDGRDQNGNPITHDPENPFEGTNIVGVFNYLFDFFKSLPSLLGDLPALVNSILGFLPLPVIAFIAAGILIAIVLRIVGR